MFRVSLQMATQDFTSAIVSWQTYQHQHVGSCYWNGRRYSSLSTGWWCSQLYFGCGGRKSYHHLASISIYVPFHQLLCGVHWTYPETALHRVTPTHPSTALPRVTPGTGSLPRTALSMLPFAILPSTPSPRVAEALSLSPSLNSPTPFDDLPADADLASIGGLPPHKPCKSQQLRWWLYQIVVIILTMTRMRSDWAGLVDIIEHVDMFYEKCLIDAK